MSVSCVLAAASFESLPAATAAYSDADGQIVSLVLPGNGELFGREAASCRSRSEVSRLDCRSSMRTFHGEILRS